MVIFIVIIIIVLLFIFFCIKYTNSDKYSFVKINDELDNEHIAMFDALAELRLLYQSKSADDELQKSVDKIYNLSKKHWDTEDRYFKVGSYHQSGGHNDTAQNINEHIAAHNNNLDRIANLKQLISQTKSVDENKILGEIDAIVNIIHEHIQIMDAPHFMHWVNKTGMPEKLRSDKQ
jgi:hypothetical protein